MTLTDPDQVLRMVDVTKRLNVSKATVRRWEKLGAIPRRRLFGPGLKGWFASEIDAWFKSRPRIGESVRH